MEQKKNIFITGASSGIGEALAYKYAESGFNLLITGRNQERLNYVSAKCATINKSIAVTKFVLDLNNFSHIIKLLIDTLKKNNIDMFIANAGVSGKTAGNKEYKSREILQTNIVGTIDIANLVIDYMISNNIKGHIAIMSSMASYLITEKSTDYCISKYVISKYFEAKRSFIKNNNIKLTIIYPGFINTKMTQNNNFYMPFMQESDSLATKIIDDLAKNKKRIFFPRKLMLLVYLVKLMPQFLIRKFM